MNNEKNHEWAVPHLHLLNIISQPFTMTIASYAGSAALLPAQQPGRRASGARSDAGALCFAVYRGKMSEGWGILSWADHIIIG